MKDRSASEAGADLPAELPSGFPKGGTRGKYHRECFAGRSTVRMVALDPELTDEFATADEVKNALRLVKQIRQGGKPA